MYVGKNSDYSTSLTMPSWYFSSISMRYNQTKPNSVTGAFTVTQNASATNP